MQQRLTESVHSQASLQELSARLVRAQEEERRALSRELHDEVAQAFSAVLMESENLLDLHPTPEVRAHLDSIRGVAEKGMNEIRNMALLLRPSMLDDFGLLPALEWQAREIGKRTGLRVQVVSEMLTELPEEHKTCVYRVVQEALNNCAQHAQASAVQVFVRQETGQILVTVQDDGTGSIRSACADWVCWAWKNGRGTWAVRSKSIPGPAEEHCCESRCRAWTWWLQNAEQAPELLWDGGLPYGADSHSAG